MKKRGMITITIIGLVVIAFAAFQTNPQDVAPPLGDNPSLTEKTEMKSNLNAQDSPVLEESADQEKTNFYIDEDGKKRYVIDASDTLEIFE